MEIVDTVKFAVGAVSLVAGAALMFRERRRRGFTRNKQTAGLLLAGGVAFLLMGLGLFQLGGR